MSRTWRFNSAPHLTWHGSQRPVVCTHYLYVINLFIKTTSGYLSIPGFEPRPTACGEENSSTTDLAWFPRPAMLHDLIQGARGPGYNWLSNHGGSKINEFVLGLLSVLNKIKLKYELRYIRTISQNSWFVYILVSFHCWKFVFCLELMSELQLILRNWVDLKVIIFSFFKWSKDIHFVNPHIYTQISIRPTWNEQFSWQKVNSSRNSTIRSLHMSKILTHICLCTDKH